MSSERIRSAVMAVVPQYPIKRVILFGSQAAGTNHENSDVDLIMEFSAPVSLLTLSEIRIHLEDLLGVDVDIIHGPLRESDLLEVNEEIELYAA